MTSILDLPTLPRQINERLTSLDLGHEMNLTIKDGSWTSHVYKTRELFVDIRDWFSPSADREHSHLNCSYFHDSKY